MTSFAGISTILLAIPVEQGIDGSASKPTLVKDNNYMVDKTYHISPYLGAFGAYLMPQGPI